MHKRFLGEVTFHAMVLQVTLGKIMVQKKKKISAYLILYFYIIFFNSRRPFSISRENSFLVNRDRTKSMESGILRQFHNQNVLYHKSSIARDFQPPYNLLSKVVKKLDKIRKDREEKEKEEVKGKVWEEKARIIVDSM